MKLPPRFGSVSKLSGARRRPWIARVTSGYTTDLESGITKQHRQIIGYYSTKKEALQALADFNNNPYSTEAAKVTFRQCYEEASKDFSPNRIHNYRSGARYLEPIMDLPIRSIRAAQLQKCIDSCSTTQQREIKTVCRKTYEYALKNDFVDKNPALYLHSNTVDAKIVREVFTPEEVSALWQNAEAWECKVALILLYSGMRTKELQDLTPNDIDLEERVIHVRKAKNKSSVRDIPIHDRVFALLSDFKRQPIIFTHNGFNKALARHTKHRAHDCRHSFATELHNRNVDLLICQLLLGHTPGNITQRIYVHISPEDLRSAINSVCYL